MKLAIAVLAVVLPAAGATAYADLPPAQQELFDAERAFVRLAEERGFRDSFHAYFADDGIAFNPHPFRVRAALANQPSTPAPMGAAWAPVYGDISAAGDLGWNTGPLVFAARNGQPARHGMFFSVWKRQPDGSFAAEREAVEIPFDELKWAKTGRGAPKAASDVLNVGDVIWVAPKNPNQPTGVWSLMQVPEVGGGLVAMDPHTGRVHAVVGGFSFATSQFDRALQAKRQAQGHHRRQPLRHGSDRQAHREEEDIEELASPQE